jgi:hypothetical protein
MAKSTYIRVFSSTSEEKCLDAAEAILEKVPEITTKHLYFPKPNENGYYAVLVRVPDGMSELRTKARCAWALQ